MAINKTGRPSDYLEEVANDICALLSNGESLRAICKRPGMPNRSTVFRWLNNYSEFRDQYARATEDRADVMFEDILDIADTVEEDPVKITKAKLKIDTRKWVLSRMNPKKYSDKQAIEHTGKDGGPIQYNFTTQDYKKAQEVIEGKLSELD